MKNYLLFDLDGTLTDPKLGITSCVQYALKSFGIEEPDLDKLEPFIGPPLKDSFMSFYDMNEEQAEKAVAKYRERFQDIGIFENKVYDGIPAMLKKLHAKGLHLAVASSKPTVYVERILEHFRIKKYFEVIVGSELDGTRVNKDEVVFEALNRLFHYKPIQRAQVYMIGDRKFDVEGAKAHQIESVGVTYGYGGMEELKAAKADYIVRSVEELQKFLLRDTEGDVSEGKQEKQAEGTGNSISQKLSTILFPIVMFIIVRSMAIQVILRLLRNMSGLITGNLKEFLYICDDGGIPVGFTTNASGLIRAVSFLMGALVIAPKAVQLIQKTKDDMRLTHLKKEPWWKYGVLALATVGAVIGLNLLFSLSGIIDQSADYQAVAQQQYATNLWIGLICYGVVAPVAEELLFRGIVHNHLRRFVNIKTAIGISGLIFGIYHMNIVQGAYGFLMGCLMAYAYEYFGSFKIPVLIHVAANVLVYCLSYVQIELTKSVYGVVCVLCLAVTILCILVLHRKKNVL